MAAKHRAPRLRWLVERARGRAGTARPPRVDARPSRYSGPDQDYDLYAEYANPLAGAEQEFMTEAREIMGLDPGPGH
jgi:hypothetical protein